jgi:hypothetical protein
MICKSRSGDCLAGLGLRESSHHDRVISIDRRLIGEGQASRVSCCGGYGTTSERRSGP